MNGQMNIFDFINKIVPAEINTCDDLKTVNDRIKFDFTGLKIIKQRSFVVYRPDWTISNGDKYIVTQSFAILSDNSVYIGQWFLYRHLKVFKNIKDSEKCFDDEIKELFSRMSKETIIQEINVHENFIDLYQCEKNEYWDIRRNYGINNYIME